MNVETQRFHDRFQSLFASEGLENVKFFVRGGEEVSFDELIEDVNRINATIAANDYKVVTSIDIDFTTRRFDEAF